MTQLKALGVFTSGVDQRNDSTKRALEALGTPGEREAAWAIVTEAMAGGWLSVGPYGPRAELYDRP